MKAANDVGKVNESTAAPEQVGRDGKGHTNLLMREWEDLGGVGKWHGTFT